MNRSKLINFLVGAFDAGVTWTVHQDADTAHGNKLARKKLDSILRDEGLEPLDDQEFNQFCD